MLIQTGWYQNIKTGELTYVSVPGAGKIRHQPVGGRHPNGIRWYRRRRWTAVRKFVEDWTPTYAVQI